MELICNREQLLRAVVDVSKGISTNSNVPILDCLKFTVGKQMSVTASDLEVTTTRFVDSYEYTGEDFSFCVDAKTLSEFLKASNKKSESVKITVNDQISVTVVCGRAKCVITGFDACDYPTRPSDAEDNAFSIDGNWLREALTFVSKSCGRDDLRPAMMGVNFRAKKGRLTLAATDAHRLSVVSGDGDSDGDFEFTMPRKAVVAILSTSDNTLSVCSDERTCVVSGEWFVSVSRLIDAKYPNYEAVIPKDNPIKVNLPFVEVSEAIKRAVVFANETSMAVRFGFSENGVDISSSDIEKGRKFEERVDGSVEGGDVEIGMNNRFVVDALSSLGGQTLSMALSSPERAAILSSDYSDRFVLLMPIKLDHA